MSVQCCRKRNARYCERLCFSGFVVRQNGDVVVRHTAYIFVVYFAVQGGEGMECCIRGPFPSALSHSISIALLLFASSFYFVLLASISASRAALVSCLTVSLSCSRCSTHWRPSTEKQNNENLKEYHGARHNPSVSHDLSFSSRCFLSLPVRAWASLCLLFSFSFLAG